MVITVETKGDNQDNSNSARKVELGRRWSDMAGQSYRYFMVFEEAAIPGALTMNDFVGTLRQMV